MGFHDGMLNARFPVQASVQAQRMNKLLLVTSQSAISNFGVFGNARLHYNVWCVNW